MMRQTANVLVLKAAMLMLGITSHPSAALEPGQAPQTKPGSAIGATAAPHPPGLYMINHLFYYGFQLTGPGVVAAPNAPRGNASEIAPAFLWVPGWSLLGPTYSACASLL